MPRGKKKNDSSEEEDEVEDFLDDDADDYDDDSDSRSSKRQKHESNENNSGGSLRRSARAVSKAKAAELPFGATWSDDDSIFVLTPKKPANAGADYGKKIAAFDMVIYCLDAIYNRKTEYSSTILVVLKSIYAKF